MLRMTDENCRLFPRSLIFGYKFVGVEQIIFKEKKNIAIKNNKNNNLNIRKRQPACCSGINMRVSSNGFRVGTLAWT